MLFDFTTQKWEDLAHVNAGFPNWSRDGKSLYFISFGKDAAVFRVRISDRKVERVVSLKNFRLTSGIAWLGLAPDDSPLLLRDASIQEIYALDWEAP